ncbi:MAG: hypothetical protein EPN79_11280 [Burkholderiaceae bacterium]|nr:MAG: hypothetical protein EPN79_11280 [Burkholderiaceae bacterium]TBR76735.1 MAG: hypothetical protein EPN64_05795 [Burkholderiaceae bacterium]
MPKWIDLNDASSARLKIATIEVAGESHLHLFITGLSYLNPAWLRAINEMGFHAGGARKYLVRRVRPGERPKASDFRAVFPHAAVREMAPESYMLNLQTARRPEERAATREERAAALDINNAVLLGRNADGDRVFEAAGSRYVIKLNAKAQEVRVDESDASQPHVYLRIPKDAVGGERTQALLQCADGFVRSMVLGEVQHAEDSDRFMRAVFGAGPYSVGQYDEAHAAIESALLRYLRDGFEVAQDAYGEAARLTDLLPPFRGNLRGAGTMPVPVSVISQRLLGDTAGMSVVVPNAYDGASFAFLAEGTTVRAYRGAKDLSALSSGLNLRASAQWQDGEFTAGREAGADALFINADPTVEADGRRGDYTLAINALRCLKDGGRAVMVLAADAVPGELSVAARNFLSLVNERYEIQSVFETAPILSRKAGVREDSPGLRIVSVVNRRVEQPQPVASTLTVISSWDDLKTTVDEAMARAKVLDAQAQGIDVERAAQEGRVQRPYIAFSRVGEARSMVPSNMQAPLQATMTRIESMYGQVDELVAREMGWGAKALAERLSPEQIDGLAMIMVRQLEGFASVLADETGIGKGRQLAALMAWALRRGQQVFLVTDRANLFSDMARDLKDIGEWDRVRAMILNNDGEITWEPGPGQEPVVLAQPFGAPRTKAMVEDGTTLAQAGLNTCFLTYSQITGIDSHKAQWVKNQLGNALIVFDESHVAAGSDSQIASHVAEMSRLAKGCQFASATWSKSEENLHIYQRALPESVNVASLSAAIKKGGESFSEVLSSMLASEGALIRREHDLSKLEVRVHTDESRRAQNESVSDAVAKALGAAAFLAGDLSQIFMRGNREAVKVLQKAREVRGNLLNAAEHQAGAHAVQTPIMRAKVLSSGFGTGSVLYQVMKAVQGALNAGQVADRALEHIRNGLKPVIVSEATNEALTRALIMEANRADGRPQSNDLPSHIKMPTIRDAVRNVILPLLTTVISREITEDDVGEDEEDASVRNRMRDAEIAAEINAEDEEDPANETTPAMQRERQDRRLLSRINGDGQTGPQEDAVNLDDAVAATQALDDESTTGARASSGGNSTRRVVKITEMVDLPQEAREAFDKGITEVRSLIEAIPPLPVSAFDVIEQKLRNAGVTIGEITGRSFSLEHEPQADNEDRWRILPRVRSKRAVNAVKRSFNNGDIQALLINRSAATGSSMHASRRFLDQSRRVLLEHQIPENVTDRIQLIGRVNRYDQVSFPLVETCTTGIYGELRYVMMQNRKLQKLSANVRSSPENAMLIKEVRDLFNSIGLEAVRGYVQDEPLVAKKLALPENFLEISGVTAVNVFLMRLPMLYVSEQRHVYEQLFARFDESFNRYELLGTNPLKTSEFDWRAREESSSVFFGDPSGERTNVAESLVAAPVAAGEEGGEAGEDATAPAPVQASQLIESDHEARAPAEHGEELLSAFDRPVTLKKISFEVDHKPLSYAACVAAAEVSAQRLAEGSFFDMDAQGVACWKPDVAARINAGMQGIVGMTAVSVGLSSEEAVVKNPGAKRAQLRAHWLKEHMDGLVPGGILFESARVDAYGKVIEPYKTGVIVDLKLPDELRDLLSAHKWKFSVVFPGAERPVVYSLRTLLSAVSGDIRVGQVAGSLVVDAHSKIYPRSIGSNETGRRFQNTLFGRGSNTTGVKDSFEFETMRTGKFRRSGYVLGGNMYMAYDWAVKAKMGRSIIFTDDKGLRQRGVLLPQTLSHIDPKFMPVRVWGGQIKPFLQRMINRNAGAGALHFSTEFMGQTKSLSIDPRVGIVLLTKSKDARRAIRLMRGEQVKRRKLELGERSTAARDPLNVTLSVVSRTARGNAAARRDLGNMEAGADNPAQNAQPQILSIPVGFVALKLGLDMTNAQQLDRALDLLMHGVGLEIYAEGSEERSLAREVGREYFAQLRLETAQRRERARQEVARAAASGAAEASNEDTRKEGQPDGVVQDQEQERLAA